MKIILHILLILIIIGTIGICTLKPDMHKNVIVYDSAYKLVEENVVQTETEQIPIMEMPEKSVQKTVSVEKQSVPVKTEYKKQETKQITKQTKPAITTEQKKEKTVTKQTPKVIETKKIETPKIVQTTQTQKTHEPKVLTEQEETIAWNIWRSNLTNKIMQDTHLPLLPAGVVFRFSFTVDKYGKISNVQTWSETSTYTPYAIQYIAPIIKSYQGRDILNFPEGTQRFSTEAKGGWRISVTEKLSTPQDYNDIEKIKSH